MDAYPRGYRKRTTRKRRTNYQVLAALTATAVAFVVLLLS